MLSIFSLSEADFYSSAISLYVAAIVAGFLGIRYIKKSRENDQQVKLSHPMDLDNQSVVLDGRPEMRGSQLSKPPHYKELIDDPLRDLSSIYDVLQRGKKLSNNGPCLGSRTGQNREYEWMRYEEVINKCRHFGSGLIHLGLEPNNDTRVGIYSKNRYEWVVSSYGLSFYSMVSVPIYDTLGPEACTHILNQADIKLVVAETETYVDQLLQKKHDAPSLQMIVMLDPVSDAVKARARKHGVEIHAFEEVLEMGKGNLKKLMIPKVTACYTISYTSGTTGVPKGVVLTVKCLIVMIQSMIHHFKTGGFVLRPEDTHLSFLPLAHNFDRGMHILMLINGCRIGYWSKDVKMLGDDLVTLQPTIFASAPRMFNRFYDAVFTMVKGSYIKSTLSKWALASKQKDVDRGVYRRDTVWDKLLLKRVQKRLGGKVRMILSGSAPLSVEVINFLRCSMGCPVIEAYGQTEATAGLTSTIPYDPSVGHVGPPLPGIQIKLVDVPEMGFHVNDNKGEICAKCEHLLVGYFKDPEKTAEALDVDGWLHTGDIGSWLPNGALKIIDRKKHIFKLSQGEYIAPEKIEVIYSENSFVLQCFVNGDSTKDKPVATVVLDSEVISAWAPKNGFTSDVKELCKNKEFKEIVLKEILNHGTKRSLKGFEQVKDIQLDWEPWSVENGLLTPTFKNKRPALKAKYWEKMQKLYNV